MMLTVYLSMLEREEDIQKVTTIYEKYYKLMLWEANKILRNQHDAEDAVHDGFCKIIKFLNELEEAEGPKTKAYVVTVARNRARDLQKARYRRNKRFQEYDEEVFYGIGNNIDSFIEREAAKMILEQLKERYLELALLKFDMGFTNEQIAEICGLKKSNVDKTMTRIRNKANELAAKLEGNDK